MEAKGIQGGGGEEEEEEEEDCHRQKIIDRQKKSKVKIRRISRRKETRKQVIGLVYQTPCHCSWSIL